MDPVCLMGKPWTFTLLIMKVEQTNYLRILCFATQVKQDCSAVYVDGSETSGALGKKILVSFAGREVYREFNVWYPELPLEVVLSDPKLSQIRGWKIPVPKERWGLGILKFQF